MAKYQNLINSISSVIRTNGNNEITGQILQDVLKSIVNVVGANPTYGGVAHPADNPGTPEGGVVYIASDEGTYINFGGLTLDDNELAVLVWDGESWSKESVTYIADFEDIEQAKQEALDAIAEAIQGLNIYYTIETDKGAVKDVQLKDGNGNNLMPRTKAEVISINIIHNDEYIGFVAGKCWLPAGLSTTSHYSAHTDLIEVKQGDVIIVENYRKFTSATGGGPFCAIYPTNEGTGGTRYNCNDVLVPDPSVALKYTFTVPKDGWIGVNIGVETQSYINACRITHQYVEAENLKDKIDELDEGVKQIEDSLYQPIDVKQVDVIIFMGQSNMGGRGIVSDTHPEDAPAVIDGAGYEFRAITDPTQLYPITKTFGKDENVDGAIDDGSMKTGGSVPAFVNNYFMQTLTPVIGISASKGATSSSNWQPSGTLLPDAINRFTTCVTWLTNNGYTIRHKYMAWCQGEADGDNGISEATYITRFTNIFNAMQSHGIEKCLMIQIGNYNGSITGRADNYVTIQGAQARICSENSDVIMVSDSFKLMQARGLMKDDWHYYQEAYNIIGWQAGQNAGIYRNVSNLNKF